MPAKFRKIKRNVKKVRDKLKSMSREQHQDNSGDGSEQLQQAPDQSKPHGAPPIIPADIAVAAALTPGPLTGAIHYFETYDESGDLALQIAEMNIDPKVESYEVTMPLANTKKNKNKQNVQTASVGCTAEFPDLRVPPEFDSIPALLKEQLISLESLTRNVILHNPHLQPHARQLVNTDPRYQRLPMIRTGYLFNTATSQKATNNYVACFKRLHS